MNIRNLAIIAHVDHGKTTLVDGLLKQSNTFRTNESYMQAHLIMDSNPQERERGITIVAKNTAINYPTVDKDGNPTEYKINIIDTPGHADFSGEVERTLNMADGALLVIDAQEGPMPQTKFVLKKALALDLKIIVVINKIDKPNRRIQEVINKTSDLFLELAAHESQLDFPIYYAVARQEKAWDKLPEGILRTGSSADNTSTASVSTNAEKISEIITDLLAKPGDFKPIFEGIISHIPAPKADSEKPFQMLVSSLDYDSYKGRYAIGKITRGIAKIGQKIVRVDKDGQLVKCSIDKVFVNKGLKREEVPEALAGDIVAITGISDVTIGDTLADLEFPESMPRITLEEPTLKMVIGANTSPFAGREGEFITARQILERIYKELETNISLKFEVNEKGEYVISGRGELHLSVFLETLRREGFEFQIGKPKVITKVVDGVELEPIEELLINVGSEYIGNIIQELGNRRGILQSQEDYSDGTTDLTFHVPTRGILGFRTIALTLSRGTAILNSTYLKHDRIQTFSSKLRRGALISFDTGKSTAYALNNAQERGTLFIGKSVEVYQGMVIGLNLRDEDLEISVTKEKKASNMRSTSADEGIFLTPPKNLSLEEFIDMLDDDELLEITPKNMRLRKMILDPLKRIRSKR